MKDLVIRIICITLIAGFFAGYDVVLAMRDKDDQIAKLTSQLDSVQTSEQAAGGSYKDGTYTGSAQGYGGTVTMEVVIKNGNIVEINALSASGEDAAYWDMCQSIPDSIIEAQSPQVDTVSGATFSSVGIINAVIAALKQAV